MPGDLSQNVVHSTLNIDGGIQDMKVYRSNDRKQLAVFITLGNKLSGHHQTLHGGITALLFDNAFGWAVYALPLEHPPMTFKYLTAFLHVDYRAPASTDNHQYVILCDIDRVEKEKKVFVKGSIIDVKTNEVIAHSNALFIAVKSEDESLRKMLLDTLECFEHDLHPSDPTKSCKL
jgi:acyl-coenzyme A thioesterase PaaI-like protein